LKDLYELFNEIEVEINEEDIAVVSDMEKKKLYTTLNQRIVKSKKYSKWKRTLSVAMVTIGIMTSAMIGLSFTAYAEDIPVLGSIFKFFSSDGSYEGYEENASKLDLVQESNGIKMTIQDTVFDGKTLFLTYMIETNKDLGEKPWINSMPTFGDSGLGGTDKISKIDDGKYVGVMEVEPTNDRKLEQIDVNWKIESISTEPNQEGISFQGNWDFQFTLNAVDTQTILANQTIEDTGITFTAENITITPMSFILEYQYAAAAEVTRNWDNIFVEVEIKDDLGNNYEGLGGAGYGIVDLLVNSSSTFGKLDPNATKLIVTPIVTLSDNDSLGYDRNGEPIKADYRSMDSKADYKEVHLKQIIVELD
jgi:Family of unknown function (DUF5643)/Domain of unknown function (DUF4179)